MRSPEGNRAGTATMINGFLYEADSMDRVRPTAEARKHVFPNYGVDRVAGEVEAFFRGPWPVR